MTPTMASVRYLLVILIVSQWLGGCASPVPKTLARAPVDNPSLEQVLRTPERFTGRTARWGGEIVEVRNAKHHSDVAILARALDEDGEPRTGSAAQGRFMARLPGFIDPAEYVAGQRITVFGRLDGTVNAAIGDYDYRYPVLAVSDWYRWPVPRPVNRYPWWYDDPFYRGPFYDPFYRPWWPHRYHHPYW